MIFSSIQFLFYFLPILLALAYLAPKSCKNLVLLLGSLFFYAYGERYYLAVMLASIFMNYGFGLAIDRSKTYRKTWLIIGVLCNLAMLAVFKYSGFVVENLHAMTGIVGSTTVSLPESALRIHLPIGISFFTFQAMSYIIDVYRNDTKVQTKLSDLALYISLFPQLVAGPIVRYRDVAEQIRERGVTLDKFYVGCKRFMLGLGKKVLLANYFAGVADHIFALPASEVSTVLAWLGIICYTLQIYYDFSAYSDMAIGLGKMFGFDFLENFNYPYMSLSIQEFWRRWHISLSSWFRDYLYISLGGNRKGIARTYFNLFIVFFLTGLWHGASWVFIVWGLFHGFFMVIERIGFKHVLDKTPKIIRSIYTLVVVMVGWVFFRSETLLYALTYLQRMFWYTATEHTAFHLNQLLLPEFYLVLALGIAFATPVARSFDKWIEEKKHWALSIFRFAYMLAIAGIFFLSLIYLSAGTYNPFIYFRF